MKHTEWISVSEKYPSEFNEYLIRLKDGQIRLVVWDAGDEPFHYFWSDNYAEETFYPDDATHWMPIPEITL